MPWPRLPGFDGADASTADGSARSGRPPPPHDENRRFRAACSALTRRLAPASLAVLLQLAQPGVADAEVMRDLVEDGFLDGALARGTIRVEPFDRAAEDGDLARHRRLVGAVDGARNSLVEPEQSACPDRRQLLWRRLIVDDDGHAVELGRERLRDLGD